MKTLSSCVVATLMMGCPGFALESEPKTPTDIFLAAYLSYQKGEQAEAKGQVKEAILKYEGASELLKRVQEKHPDWNPAIVEFRVVRITKALKRLTPDQEAK